MALSYARSPQNQPTRICACGTVLAPMKHQGNPRKWCSESCRLRTVRNGGVPRPARIPRQLEQCERCDRVRPHGQRFCSWECRIADGQSRRAVCAHEGCDGSTHAQGLCRTHYKKTYGAHWRSGSVESRKARDRIKTYRRKSMVAAGDFTVADDIALRRRTKRCPLCHVRLIDEPYLPASKELDHIVPRGIGGTHTHGNVRIICRACNLARPKDGSDYTGPVTLFAQEVA